MLHGRSVPHPHPHHHHPSPSPDTSGPYLTPDTTLAEQPESPCSLEYRTPDADRSFAMPSYFEHKRRPASQSGRARPLLHFRAFKQKSLNTIPASLERARRGDDLFHNFPFLTPLAARKNSLLGDCGRDDFWAGGRDVLAALTSLASTPLASRPRSDIGLLRSVRLSRSGGRCITCVQAGRKHPPRSPALPRLALTLLLCFIVACAYIIANTIHRYT